MNNRVAVILPYFGALPNYFELFLKSAEENKDFDFLIFTDCEVRNESDNIKVFIKSFDWFKTKLQAVIDIPIVLDTPYKLCDYKPAYGQALYEYIKEYNFWGYCDPDLIFGRLSDFINDEILNKYDRIYHLGHFCIYRNNDEMNHLYTINHGYSDCFSYKYAYGTKFVCAYDEVGTKYGYGLSEVCKRNKLKEYRSIDFADAMPQTYNFLLDNIEEPEKSAFQFFEWKKGMLYGHRKDDTTREFAYVHLQKRKMCGANQVKSENYFVSPCAFRKTAEDAVADVNNMKMMTLFKNKKISELPKRKLGKLKRGALKVYFDRKYKRINI